MELSKINVIVLDHVQMKMLCAAMAIACLLAITEQTIAVVQLKLM